ncbi:hypothetical protein, partial [Halomonas sp. 3D7M]|uniref:hypothetical protein n=1 Tax=Halomonas sp. 3D7M TaxID=2742617 RepID=UPI001D0048E6
SDFFRASLRLEAIFSSINEQFLVDKCLRPFSTASTPPAGAENTKRCGVLSVALAGIVITPHLKASS